VFAFAEQQAGQQIDLLLFGQTLRLGKAGGKLFRQIRPGSDIYQTKVNSEYRRVQLGRQSTGC
jgi:hypothetical protein